MILRVSCIVSAVVAAVMLLVASTLALIAKDAGTTSLTAEIIAVWATLPGTFSVVMAVYLGGRWAS